MRDVHFAEHRDGFYGVEQRDVLRRADDDRAGERQDLREREGDVAGAGRHVDDQVIEVAPFGIAQELRDRAVEHWATPHDGFAGRDEEAHAHDAQVVFGDWLESAVFQVGAFVDAQEMRNAGAVDVGVHQPDDGTGVLQAVRNRCGDRAFADAAFAGADGDYAFCR